MRTITQMPDNYCRRVEEFKERFSKQHEEYLKIVKDKEQSDRELEESKRVLNDVMSKW